MTDMFDDIRRMQEHMDRMMNRMLRDFWDMPIRNLLPGEVERPEAIERYRRPFTDLIETDKEVIATVDMPGLEKGDININLTQDRLEVSGEKKYEEEKKEKGYIYKERRSGSYYRSMSLPSSVDPDNAKATYNNGVLQITMPKTEIKKKTPLKVD